MNNRILYFGISLLMGSFLLVAIPVRGVELNTLGASTYIGGNYYDSIAGMAMDSAKNVYLVGTASDQSFPTTPGAYDTSHSSNPQNVDIFVAKFSPDLSQLLASTFIGSSGFEQPHGIVIDTLGNVFISAYTYNSDFPVTNGAYDTSFNGASEIVIAKFSADLKTLKASTFLGGVANESEPLIALDSSGNVYISGLTASNNFPILAGSYDSTFDSKVTSGFIAKFSSSLNSLLASTYVDGGQFYSLAIDAINNVYIGGHANTKIDPTGSGYDQALNGANDGVIAKYNASLSSLLSWSFLGGSDTETIKDIAFDSLLNVYVIGGTNSNNFPVTNGSYDTSSNGMTDVFVSKFSSNLKNLIASTYIGGTKSQVGMSIVLDGANVVYVTGDTDSVNFPITVGAYDTTANDGDIFLSSLSSELNSLLSSTYIGGKSVVGIEGYQGSTPVALEFGLNGSLYIAGITGSSFFPTTLGAYDTGLGVDGWASGEDGFVVYFSGVTSNPPLPISKTLPLSTLNTQIKSNEVTSFTVFTKLPATFISKLVSVQETEKEIKISPVKIKTENNQTTLLFSFKGISSGVYQLRLVDVNGTILAESLPLTFKEPTLTYLISVNSFTSQDQPVAIVNIYPGFPAYEKLTNGTYQIQWVNEQNNPVTLTPISVPQKKFSLILSYTYQTSSLIPGIYIIQLYDTVTKSILASKQMTVVVKINATAPMSSNIRSSPGPISTIRPTPLSTSLPISTRTPSITPSSPSASSASRSAARD
ncbi:MAG: SBBP repeat-containing protein [Candidatus Magasanikbacteria bacterium]|nr:SBBP repeat-containing protein [Candidatus Magasanikbacteria bacterium]